MEALDHEADLASCRAIWNIIGRRSDHAATAHAIREISPVVQRLRAFRHDVGRHSEAASCRAAVVGMSLLSLQRKRPRSEETRP
jgi:hypothetical protein